MLKNIKINYLLFILLTTFLVFSGGVVVYAINTVATGFQVNNGTTVTIDAFSVCQKVTNSTGKNIFVPTKTSAEWLSFRNNRPSGVSLSSCCIPQVWYRKARGCEVAYTRNWNAPAQYTTAATCSYNYCMNAHPDFTSVYHYAPCLECNAGTSNPFGNDNKSCGNIQMPTGYVPPGETASCQVTYRKARGCEVAYTRDWNAPAQYTTDPTCSYNYAMNAHPSFTSVYHYAPALECNGGTTYPYANNNRTCSNAIVSP